MNKQIKSIITGVIFGIAFWVFCLTSFIIINLSDALSEIYFFSLPDPFVFLVILYALVASLIIILALKLPETWWQLITFAIASALVNLIVTFIWSMFDSDLGLSVMFYGSLSTTLLSTACQLVVFLVKRLRRLR